MTSITVCLPEERLLKLQELAARLTISPDELARIGVEELLALPDDEFQRAMDDVLKKNAELYLRLHPEVPNVIDVRTWEEFEEELKKLRKERDERQQKPGPLPSGLLFRGQENSCWPLTTTLERSKREGIALADYYDLVCRVKPQIETFVGPNWDIPEYGEIKKSVQGYETFFDELLFGRIPAYDFLAYLRHHGFPSPLLDWTRSPYIAAFFAFRYAQSGSEKVSIYVYQESPHGGKGRSSSKPQIKSLTPYVRTHRRHSLQQCEYTICVIFEIDGQGWRFAEHENVFAREASQNFQQDVLWKFNIPSTERLKVLELLEEYNLNAFSLFGSEESLTETMALRELDFRKKDS